MFGVVMIAGAVLLVCRLVDSRAAPHAALVIAGTWALALVAAGVARALVLRVSRPLGDRWFAVSVALPAVGIAALLPLTIHLPLVLLVANRALFDDRARGALLFTGTAHLALSLLVGARALQLVAGRPALSPRAIYVITVLVACVPCALLLGIPPAIVALTGIPCLRLLHHLQHLVEHERALAASAPAELPRAVVHAGR